MAEGLHSVVNDYELHRVLQSPVEDFDTQITIDALKKYETRRNPSGMMRSAWNYAEHGLYLRAGQKEARQEYFHSSQYLISRVIDHPKVHQDTVLSALTLSTYIPLFSKRASEIEISSLDCEEVYRSLGRAMNYLRPLDIDEPPQWRMVENAMLALSARSRQPQLLMYPASPREEASATQSLNHDSYFLDQNGKVPVQQKLLPTQKIYDECIKVLTVQPLLDRALRKSGETQKNELSEKVNYLLSLIIAETCGYSMTREEVSFLNTMTESVVSHYFTSVTIDDEFIAA